MKRLDTAIRTAFAFCVVFAGLCGGAAVGEEPWPPFVAELIEKLEAAPVRNPPASITRYDYRGMEVYYVPPYCCDRPGELYDKEGIRICLPDGGITGQGDGRCRDFFELRTNRVEIWRDPRRRR